VTGAGGTGRTAAMAGTVPRCRGGSSPRSLTWTDELDARSGPQRRSGPAVPPPEHERIPAQADGRPEHGARRRRRAH
jgi:hypothetical protein